MHRTLPTEPAPVKPGSGRRGSEGEQVTQQGPAPKDVCCRRPMS
ncbi:hypothetical protein [Streptomyces dysideae]|nr:hypothetical protein [Streptomyces dysideae]